jgi:hypothetical protein
MTITFHKQVNPEYLSRLSITTKDNDISLHIHGVLNGFDEPAETHTFSKEELKEFIGALLHIQSKLNKQF